MDSNRSLHTPVPSVTLPSNMPPHLTPTKLRVSSESSIYRMKDKALASGAGVDIMSHLQRSESTIVKTRSGSVLSRGFILKTDHYPSGRALDLEINVHGAPNFRAPHLTAFTSPATSPGPASPSPSGPATPSTNPPTNLNVYGCAQPRTQGLRAILSVLNCRPKSVEQGHVVWFCTREEPIGRHIIQPRRRIYHMGHSIHIRASICST